MSQSAEKDAGRVGPCWADSGHSWPGMPDGVTVRCDLPAGHAGAHEADRGSMGGTAVWPNDDEHGPLAMRLYVALVEQRVIDSQKYGEAPYAPITPEGVREQLESVRTCVTSPGVSS